MKALGKLAIAGISAFLVYKLVNKPKEEKLVYEKQPESTTPQTNQQNVIDQQPAASQQVTDHFITTKPPIYDNNQEQNVIENHHENILPEQNTDVQVSNSVTIESESPLINNTMETMAQNTINPVTIIDDILAPAVPVSPVFQPIAPAVPVSPVFQPIAPAVPVSPVFQPIAIDSEILAHRTDAMNGVTFVRDGSLAIKVKHENTPYNVENKKLYKQLDMMWPNGERASY